jgi:hypothetical protein
MAKACKGNIMSYRQSMGTMYATAGLGAAALVDKTALNTTGAPSNGAAAVKEQRPVRVLQLLLQGRGFDPGSIDGVWGSDANGVVHCDRRGAGFGFGGQAVRTPPRSRLGTGAEPAHPWWRFRSRPEYR